MASTASDGGVEGDQRARGQRGGVEGERRWPRAGVSKRWRRGRATVASRAIGEPEVSGDDRCRRGREEVASSRGQRAVASRASNGGVEGKR
ncbi:hypothetical protein ACJRO7_007594 [Eucalyptus globulus]|uniref:Uncharacterized protein n=1 Tax=Eucalyptus globulus TaxID=34317 RepID=A0ABD3IP64_EUCGL